MPGPSVFVELRANISEFSARLGEARAEMEKTQKSGSSSFSGLHGFATAALAGIAAGAVAVATESIHLADEFEKSHARLVTALTDTGQSFDQWKGQISAAEKQGEKFGLTNATIEDALSRLEIAVKNPATALKDLSIAEDLAAARGIDLNTASQLVARASNGSYTALVKLGVVTKDQAKSFHDGAEAVNFLGDAFKGQAQAQAETFGGKIAALKAQAEDLGKNFGLWLIPKIEAVATALGDGVKWLEQHGAAMKVAAAVVATVMVPALIAWAAAQAAALGASALAQIQIYTAMIGNLAREMTAMGLASDIATGPLGMLAAAVAAVALSWGDTNKASKGATDQVSQFTSALPDGINKVAALQTEFNKLKDTYMAYVDAGGKGNAVVDGQSMSFGQLQDKMQAVGSALDKAQSAQKNQTQAAGEAKAVTKDLAGAQDDTAASTENLKEQIKAETDAAKTLKSALDELVGKHVSAIDAAVKYGDDMAKLTDSFAKQTVAASLVGPAQDKVTAAADRLKAAQDALGVVEQRVTDGKLKGVAAADALRAAHDRVTLSSDALKQMQDALSKVQLQASQTAAGNTATLDINTAAGRANMTQLDATVKSILAQGEAMVKEGQTTQTASETVNQHIQALEGVMRQAGISQDAIDKYIAAIHATPAEVATALDATLNLNTSTAAQAIQDMANRVAAVKNQLRIVSEGKTPIGGAFAAGGITSGPTYLVGEGNPAFPEWVIPSDPSHRQNALALYESLGQKLYGMASGGIIAGAASLVGTGAGLDTAMGRAYLNQGLADAAKMAQAAAQAFTMPAGIGMPVNVPGGLGGWIAMAEALTGVGAVWTPALAQLIMFESGGNPNAINLWDSNAKAGHPSQGLMQTIPGTFAAYMLPGHGNILNPVDNIVAGIRYIEARYGDIFHTPGMLSLARGGPYVGYDSGGILKPGVTVAYNGTGANEYVSRTPPASASPASSGTPGSGPGGGDITVTVHAPTNADPHQIGQELAWVLKTAL